MDKVFVIVLSMSLIALIAWWFFGKKNHVAVETDQTALEQSGTITVDGGYSPQILSLAKGKPAKITFLRKDVSSCLEEVIMPDFGIAEKLPVNKPFIVSFTPKAAGDYTYTCGMRMFSGIIRVV
ncbi:MAG: cupredoxin domain-containing protein [Candidatus Saccharimonadales bacterium]